MKRWITFAAALYPRSWREEFGEEFSALLEDVKPGWRVFANVLGGAIRMQIASGAKLLKIAAATAAAGAIVAAGVGFMVAPHYVSTAVMSITPQPDPLRPMSPQAIRQRSFDRIVEMQNTTLSRASLSEIIRRPALDLYKKERRQSPIEDVVEQMRRDIRIRARWSADGGLTESLSPIVLDISFAYPDQAKAQGVVRELANRFAAANAEINRKRGTVYRSFWQDQSAVYHTKPAPPAPVGDIVAVLNPASLPTAPVGPNRIVFLAWGLGTGLLLGLLAAIAMRWPRGVLRLSGFAAAGCVLAGAASFLLPNRYISTAVMEIAPAQLTEDPLAALPVATPAAEFLRQVKPQILSFENLSRIIRNPGLDLYPRERSKRSMEEVIRDMLARDLRIAAVSPSSGAKVGTSAFIISFSYSDKHKAQAVVQTLITGFIELNLARADPQASQSSTLHEILQRGAGENLNVLDSPSYPEKPTWPNRLTIAAIGLGIGLLLGAIALRFQRPRTPAQQPA
jgi:uncharacterized protein involved in exopolysaccharide biosynthesis